MTGVPHRIEVQDLENALPDIPQTLLEKIKTSPKAQKLLRQYGRLLFTPPENRVEHPGAEQLSMKLFSAGQPHCAPAARGTRIVIFFVLQPRDFRGVPYDKYTQMSKEKLFIMLWEALHKQCVQKREYAWDTDGVYLIGKFLEAFRESCRFGAQDNTLIVLQDERYKEEFSEVREMINASEHLHVKTETKSKSILYRLMSDYMSDHTDDATELSETDDSSD